MWQQFAAASVLVLLGFSTALNHDSEPVLSCHDVIQRDVWPCDFPPPPCEGRTELLLPDLDLYDNVGCDLFGDGSFGWVSLKCGGPCYKSYYGYVGHFYGKWGPLPQCIKREQVCSDPVPPVNGMVTGYPDENGNYTCGTRLVRTCPICHKIDEGFVRDVCTCLYQNGLQCKWGSEFSTFENNEANPNGVCNPIPGCCTGGDSNPCNTSNIQCGSTKYQPVGKDGMYVPGTRITWTVGSGYALSENHTTAVCQCNGTWSRPTPCCACTRIPNEIPNGRIEIGDCTDGENVTYTVVCDNGYHRFGPKFYHCRKGIQTPLPFSSRCVKTPCPCEAPEGLPNADMIQFRGTILATRGVCYVSPTYKCKNGRTTTYSCISANGRIRRTQLSC